MTGRAEIPDTVRLCWQIFSVMTRSGSASFPARLRENPEQVDVKEYHPARKDFGIRKIKKIKDL